jgi:divalent metal cation (Fe/Co/Zn/Cd) transporter
MVIEAAAGIGAWLAAGSLALLAFGLDSVIELASASVLIWRLSVELRHGQAFSERAERLASRIGGGLLFALAAYILVAADSALWLHRAESVSIPGLIVTVLAVPVMCVLARRKIAVAQGLNSRALRADAMEAVTCGWLSLVAAVSVVMRAVSGYWWVDPVGALAIVRLVVREAGEAWSGDDCTCCEP